MKRLIGTVSLLFALLSLLFSFSSFGQRRSTQYEISEGYSQGFNIRLLEEEGRWKLVVIYRDEDGNVNDSVKYDLESRTVQIWGGDKRNTFKIDDYSGIGQEFNPWDFLRPEPNEPRPTITTEHLKLSEGNPDVKLFAKTHLTDDLAIIGMEDMRDSRIDEPPHDSVPGVIRPDSWEIDVVAATLDWLSLNRKRVRLWVAEKNGYKSLQIQANAETRVHYTSINPCDFTKMKWGKFDNDDPHVFWCKYYGKSSKKSASKLKRVPSYPLMLSDQGDIQSVFMRWIAKSDSCFTEQEIANKLDNTHQGYFLQHANLYDPCFLIDVMYSVNVTGNYQDLICDAELIQDLIQVMNEFDALAITRDDCQQYVAVNSPFSAYYLTQFSFSDADKKLSEYEINSPLDFIQSVTEVSGQLEYPLLKPDINENGEVLGWSYVSNGAQPSGYMVLRFDKSRLPLDDNPMFPNSRPAVEEVFKDVSIELKRKLLETVHKVGISQSETFKSLFNSAFTTDAEVRRIDLNSICGGDSECVESFKRYMIRYGKFVQDRFHVRSANDSLYLNPSFSTVGLTQGQVKQYINGLCADTLTALPNEPLVGMPGGNIFVFDDYAFVGKDEIIPYLSNLDTPLDPTEVSEIEDQLLVSIYGAGNTRSKQLIWLGTEELISRYRRYSERKSKFFQPIYHIDLFFQPLGDLGDGKVSFVFAELEVLEPSDTANSFIKNRFEELKLQLHLVRENVVSQLGGEAAVNEVIVPILVDFDNNEGSKHHGYIESYSNWLNGLFTFDVDGSTLIYLQPVRNHDFDQNGDPKAGLQSFQNLLRIGINNDIGHPFRIEQVMGSYSQISGLRCEVKVLGRE